MASRNSKRIVLGAALATIVLASGCGFKNDKQGDTGSTASLSALMSTPGQIPGYNTLKAQIFSPKCISCHGSSGGVSLETYASAVAAAAGIQTAVLDQKVMPPSGPLSSVEQSAIQAWLSGGMPENDVTSTGSPSPTPTATPVPSSSPTSGAVTYAQVNSQIFTPYCVSCHSGSSPSAGVDLSTYSNVIRYMSDIQQQVLVNQSMPPRQTLSSANQTLLKTWIDAGGPQ